MRIALLARQASSPTTQLLLNSADRLGLDLQVVPISELSLSSKGLIAWQSVELLSKDWNWVWPRLGLLSYAPALPLLRDLEQQGFALVNSSHGFSMAMDKITSVESLLLAGFPVPRTWSFHPETQLHENDFHDTSKFWIKTQFGSQGIGVSWAASPMHALAQVDLIRVSQGSGVLQEHVAGDDIRVLVWRGKVLAAMKRIASEQNPRANLSQGATGEYFECSPEIAALAIRACEHFGLNLAGVDFILSPEGPVILEVNPSPGFAGISKICGVDVAGLILQSLRDSP